MNTVSQLFTGHNVLVFLLTCILGAGWLTGKISSDVAIPILLGLTGLGTGASVMLTGVNAGVPLSADTPAPAATKGSAG